MKIISRDNCFISAMACITKQVPISNADDLVIFDAGQHYVYIFHSSALQKYRISDPYRALMYCCDYRIVRDAPINEYIQCLLAEEIKTKSSSRLSRKDEWIIKILFCEPDADELRERLCINRKTFSAHKVKALRKLGVKNVNFLHSLLQAWKEHWPSIRSELQREAKYKCPPAKSRNTDSRLSRI
ncbi:hypothetical protein SIL08_04570 [Scandinavium sp. V105_16]|uniref:HTH luxR-type domain-containing protein n=1 Tax=Scandinavium lactucae TaxID=3095028 RepID=A0AAJ2S746_9ENTR|nr:MULTISPECIES: hypothetical protein [unclassified Scandinavium]MDX6019568.1 hypothetical protein [Scandinavium sp. V105_16]MDX6030993.1 hypothetical protein [Scandinavium sp. V105_12]MDX6039898.1 hypothetical protein [Scandinavium sp. V105_6]MDX6051901.1 hypothetical protein [Scandinavium sp. V105_1]